MASRFTNASVVGQKECAAAFKKLPDVAKDRLGEATEKTAFAILQKARAHVLVRTGALKAALDTSYSKATGVAKVGIKAGAATIIAGEGGSALKSKGAKRYTPGSYGHLIEFGHGSVSAHPFMIPAAEAEKDPYLERCRRAGKDIESDLSKVGGSFL